MTSDIGASISRELNVFLQRTFSGAAEDIQTVANEIAQDISQAIIEQRTDLVENLQGQLKMLAEKNRLRVIGNGWRFIDAALNTIIQVGIAALMHEIQINFPEDIDNG